MGVLLTDDSPIRDVSLRHLTNLFPDLLITVLAIIRDGKVVIPRSGAESMQTGDRVYFVCDAGHLHRAMASFGHEEPEARSVVIAGGGSIGQMLAREIGSNFENTAVQIIELSPRAPAPLPRTCRIPASSMVTRLTAPSCVRQAFTVPRLLSR